MIRPIGERAAELNSARANGRQAFRPCSAGCGRTATECVEVPIHQPKTGARARLQFDLCRTCCSYEQVKNLVVQLLSNPREAQG